jgi:hypothetical protein
VAASRRWLLFVHQLPSQPSNLRVRTWRRLQQLGAIPLKQAVYLLPDTPAAREDFEWLKAEVKGEGGDATVFSADNVDAWSDDAIVDEFRRARQDDYDALARDIEDALLRAAAAKRPRGTRAPALRRLVDIFRERLASIEHIDFFGSAGRDRAAALITQIEERASPDRRRADARAVAAHDNLAAYRSRLWVTRPRPGVDRMASAWLIRQFVDPHAHFAFAAELPAVPEHGVPFDMFGAEFSHTAGGCTFETLCATFGLDRPALARVAAIVHDLDLKDGRFGAPECGTVGALIEGLQLAYQDDDTLLEHGMVVFESLYRSFEQSVRTAGPRPVAKPRPRAGRQRSRSRSKRR